ncbi:hypothetical protein BJ170DRAFT_629545 [Xylariales sp. AK1849]|nr:hypothetical protein BJ170DRAFT_629545 [Xylariales sp. AK1849]
MLQTIILYLFMGSFNTIAQLCSARPCLPETTAPPSNAPASEAPPSTIPTSSPASLPTRVHLVATTVPYPIECPKSKLLNAAFFILRSNKT